MRSVRSRSARRTSDCTYALSALLGRWLTKMWWAGLQYDWIDSDDNTADFNKGTATVSYSPRENIRIYLIGRGDFKSSGDKENEVLMNIRAMF